jgi:hypothetical protein
VRPRTVHSPEYVRLIRQISEAIGRVMDSVDEGGEKVIAAGSFSYRGIKIHAVVLTDKMASQCIHPDVLRELLTPVSVQ